MQRIIFRSVPFTPVQCVENIGKSVASLLEPEWPEAMARVATVRIAATTRRTNRDLAARRKHIQGAGRYSRRITTCSRRSISSTAGLGPVRLRQRLRRRRQELRWRPLRRRRSSLVRQASLEGRHTFGLHISSYAGAVMPARFPQGMSRFRCFRSAKHQISYLIPNNSFRECSATLYSADRWQRARLLV
jgi:hypothetical protein